MNRNSHFIYIYSYINSNIFGYSKPIFHLAMSRIRPQQDACYDHRQENNVMCVKKNEKKKACVR